MLVPAVSKFDQFDRLDGLQALSAAVRLVTARSPWNESKPSFVVSELPVLKQWGDSTHLHDMYIRIFETVWKKYIYIYHFFVHGNLYLKKEEAIEDGNLHLLPQTK